MGLTVGVTFFIHDGPRRIWVNGGFQNAVFLSEQLRRCSNVDRVIDINGGDGDRPDPGMMLGGREFVRFEEVADELDVYIECGAQIPPSHAERVHRNGGAVVGYRFGNSLILDCEKLIAGTGKSAPYNGTRFDAIWSPPQHMATNASYWEACYRCPVVEVPHIWDPTFIDAAAAELPEGKSYAYQPGRGRKRIVVLEPNIDLVKLCIIPMLAADLLYREHPELLDYVVLSCTDRLARQKTFQSIHNQLEMARHKAADGLGVVRCVGRYPTPWMLSEHADIVLAHQWENGLNYVYYEALYGRYPLVHNSDLLPAGVGYHYEGFDAHRGADMLEIAARHHDQHWLADYDGSAGAFLRDRVYTSAPANVAAHTEALATLERVMRKAAA